MEQLLATTLPEHNQLVLVGSSMGAYVSTVASEILKPDGLFLLAPAFYNKGYAVQNPVPYSDDTLIVHGWNDDVIAYQNSIQFAAEHRCSLMLLDSDHRLNDAIKHIGYLFDLFLTNLFNSDEIL